MRDPLAANTDPTDEELERLFRSAFAPKKLCNLKLNDARLQNIRDEVATIIGDTHLQRIRNAVDVALAL